MLKLLISLLFILSSLWIPRAAFSVEERKSNWWLLAEQEAKTEGYTLLTVNEVKALYDSGRPFLILDVRPGYEYQMGHLLQAINLEFHLGDRLKLSPERMEKLLNILGPDKSRQIVIYCRSYS